MTILEMLEQSAILTVLGMAMVFAFLWLLIVCMNITAWLVRKLGLDKDVRQAPGVPAVQKPADAEITAVIAAAVTEYRKKEAENHE